MVMRRLWEMREKAPGISALEAPLSVLVSSSTLFPVIIIIMYFWLHWVFVAAHGLSLVTASGAYSLAMVCGLLIVAASLVAEHRL